MKRATLFIDGGHLSKLLKEHFYLTPIEYRQFIAWACYGYYAENTYYYDCLPYMPKQPTKEDNERLEAKRRFFNMLRRTSALEVREGVVEYRGDDAKTGKPIYVQKRVDLKLGLDLALIAASPKIEAIVMVCGDSDMIPAVEHAKKEGKLFRLIHGPKGTFHEDLRRMASQAQEITWDVINRYKFTRK